MERTSFTLSGIAPGSPGPLLSMMPSGFHAWIAASVVFIGNTRTRQSRSMRQRSMLRFTPKSTNATRKAPSAEPTSYSLSVVTLLESSNPAISGAAASVRFRTSRSISVELMMAFCAPLSRMWRTSFRVSMSLMPTTPSAFNRSSKDPLPPGRLHTSLNFFTTSPAMLNRGPSTSSSFTP